MKHKLMKVYLNLVRWGIGGSGLESFQEEREILRELIGIDEEVIQKQIYQPIKEIYSGVLDMRKEEEYHNRAMSVVDRFEEMYNMIPEEAEN